MIRTITSCLTKSIKNTVIPGSKLNQSLLFDNGKLIINFDDSAISLYTDGLPVFISKGCTATCYTNGILAGGTNQDFCRWDELLEMYNAGLDIQCHTYGHIRLTEKTAEEIETDLLQQNQAFIAGGLPAPQHLAYPEGLYNAFVKTEVAKLRKTARCSAPYRNFINRGSDKFALTSYWIDASTAEKVTQAKVYMDETQSGKGALMLSAHGVTAAGSSSSVTTAHLEEIIDYARTIGMDIINISQLYRLMMRNYVHPTTDLTLTATGTGAGVATLTIVTSEDSVLRLSGGAKFYTDAAGTQGESETRQLYAGQSTVYIKCTSGTSILTIEHDRVTQIRGFVSITNAPSLGGDLSLFTNLNYLNITGQNTLSGSITNMVKLTFITVTGSNTLSGSVADLTLLTQLYVTGSNTLTGSVEGLTNILILNIGGNNTLSGSIAGLTTLRTVQIDGTLTQITVPNVTNIKGLHSLKMFQTMLTSANVNQILADFWLNKDEAKAGTTRYIGITGNAYSEAPTGQGLVDKANLQAYRSPNNDEAYALWTVTTR